MGRGGGRRGVGLHCVLISECSCTPAESATMQQALWLSVWCVSMACEALFSEHTSLALAATGVLK